MISDSLKLSIVLWTLVPLVLLCACSSTDKQESVQLDVLMSAQQVGDEQSAVQAIHNLIALYPTERKWRDSLALTYFRAQRYEEAYLASKVSLSSAQKNQSEQLLRLAAESSKVLGLYDESLKLHLRLLEFQPTDPVLLYDIGLIYYSLLQLSVGIQYMERVIGNPESAKLMLAVRGEKGEQKVSYAAAALNAKGYGLIEQGNFSEAQKALEAALQLSSDFDNARANLRYLDSSKRKIAQ